MMKIAPERDGRIAVLYLPEITFWEIATGRARIECPADWGVVPFGTWLVNERRAFGIALRSESFPVCPEGYVPPSVQSTAHYVWKGPEPEEDGEIRPAQLTVLELFYPGDTAKDSVEYHEEGWVYGSEASPVG